MGHASTNATVTAFLRSLGGFNKRASATTAYRADLSRFVRFLTVFETNFTIAAATDITRADVAGYLSSLGGHRLSDTTRASSLIIQESFHLLEEQGFIARNLTFG